MQAQIDYQKIQKGDVILTSGKNCLIKIGNFLLGHWDALKWTHVGISLGGTQIVEALPGGICVNDLNDCYTKKDEEFLVLRHKEISASEREKIADFCKNTKGDKYDGRALWYFFLSAVFPTSFGLLLNNRFAEWILNVKEAYFCSELAASGFLSVGVPIIKRKPWQTMPADFFDLKKFDLILKFEKDK